MIDEIVAEILAHKPEVLPRIITVAFQLQPGGYGHGDHFCGTRLPILRKIAKAHKSITLSDCEALLRHNLHDARFVALVILTLQFKKFPSEVCDIFMNNLKYINNWDLVDNFSHYILGEHCIMTNDNSPILTLSNSEGLWENRISIVSTFAHIKRLNFVLTCELCDKFINHDHHLIHKACGWMLREISKRAPEVVMDFIQDHPQMPSVMRSYALEWLKKKAKSM